MCWAFMQCMGDDALPRKMFSRAWSARNDDGAGLMYCVNGKLIVEKPFYKLKQFCKAYYKAHAAYGKTSPIVGHMRFSTGGDLGEDNVHPHMLIPDECALVHNGILHFNTIYEADKRSDTRYFCDTVLAYRSREFIMSQAIHDWLEEMIGPSNKFVIMDNTGHVSIVNESQGMWDGNRWFSNAAHKQETALADMKNGFLARYYRNRINGQSEEDATSAAAAEQAEFNDEADCWDGYRQEESLFAPPGEDMDNLTELEWQSRHLAQAFDEAMVAGDDDKCREIIGKMTELYGDESRLPKHYQNVL